ncbi:MAG: MucR family transcriptional regulator, partial [Nitrospiraceae bacterium]
MTDTKTELLAMTTEVIAAYVGNNAVAVDQFPSLIKEVHQALAGLGSEDQASLTPAVPIKKSVRKATIVCLECGQSGKMLKRHLSTAHGLGVNEYRERWKLPADYPMVAPNYAAVRSELAK